MIETQTVFTNQIVFHTKKIIVSNNYAEKMRFQKYVNQH